MQIVTVTEDLCIPIPKRIAEKYNFSPNSEEILPSDIVVIDGQMSTHPKLINFVDYSIWIGCSMISMRI